MTSIGVKDAPEDERLTANSPGFSQSCLQLLEVIQPWNFLLPREQGVELPVPPAGTLWTSQCLPFSGSGRLQATPGPATPDVEPAFTHIDEPSIHQTRQCRGLLCMYGPRFTWPSPLDGHVGCVHALALGPSAAGSLHVQRSHPDFAHSSSVALS